MGEGRITREQRHAQVAALRDQGLTFDQIARQLGLGMSTVTSAFYDPTGEKDRERKTRRFGYCADCGAKVTNSGSEPPERCGPCAIKHSKTFDARWEMHNALVGRPVKWSDEAILARIRGLASLGDVSVTAYNRRYADLPAGTMPSLPTVINRFGSWNAAVEAAGLPVANPRSPYTTRWTAENVLDAVTRCAAEVGHLPTYGEYDRWSHGQADRPSATRVRQLWGTWMDALDAIDLETAA